MNSSPICLDAISATIFIALLIPSLIVAIHFVSSVSSITSKPIKDAFHLLNAPSVMQLLIRTIADLFSRMFINNNWLICLFLNS